MKLSGSGGLGQAGTEPSLGLYSDTRPQQSPLLFQSLRGQRNPRWPLSHNGFGKSLVFLTQKFATFLWREPGAADLGQNAAPDPPTISKRGCQGKKKTSQMFSVKEDEQQ